MSCDTHFRLLQTPTPEKCTPGTPQVVWEVNEWDSPSNDSRPSQGSPQEPPCQQAAPEKSEDPPSAVRQAVLLPWDMM